MSTLPEIIAKPIEERTDRELEISKVFLQKQANAKLTSIQNNLSFFFWLTMISFGIGVLAYIISES